MARRNPWMKAAIALVVIAAIGWLFLRTVQDARSAPYTIRADDLRGWRVAVSEVPDPDGPLVGLRAPASLGPDLFKQLFARTMESMTAPAIAQIPLVLRPETGADAMPADAVIALAREAGLESAVLVPRCLALRRISEPSNTRDYYYLIFEDGPVRAFREAWAGRASTGGAEAAGVLPPVMIVATSDRVLRSVLPFTPDADRDCLAPIAVQ